MNNATPPQMTTRSLIEYQKRQFNWSPWCKWFAWHPVKVKGKRVWLRTVYRRGVEMHTPGGLWTLYEYGTIFDVLTD
jgi:hypothetical protein